MSEENQTESVDTENGEQTQSRLDQTVTYTDADAVEAVNMYRKPPRLGSYTSKLGKEEAERLQRRKTLFMHISTLLFAVSILLPVGGRDILMQISSLKAVTTLYLIAVIALIVISVYVSVKGRLSHRIGIKVKASAVPRDGLDRHTFWSYELFNALHALLAVGESVIACLSIGKYGALDAVRAIADIAVIVGSAVCAWLSRNILFKANSGNTVYNEPTEQELKEYREKSQRRSRKKKKEDSPQE